MTNPRKALFIQLRRIGDVLMCTPSVRAFKKRYPECKLDFLTELPDVLQNNAHIDYIRFVDHSREFNFSYQFNLIRGIRATHYDLVVDFFATARSAYYSFLSGAKTRLSYGYGHRRWAYNLVPNKKDKAIYAAADRLNLLAAIDVPPDGLELDFIPSDADRDEARQALSDCRDPIITMSPVSRRDYRRWPPEKFSALADQLVNQLDATILVLAGPGEKDIAEQVVKHSKSDIGLLCVETLGKLGAIFERSRLHIGNDNGPKHLAVACGAPTLTIFGPDSPAGWTFPDLARHQWIGPANLCDDCRRKKRSCQGDCIREIPVDAVWEKVMSMTKALQAAISEK